MTTLVKFSPSNVGSPPFQFIATLDGAQYTVSVTWNFAAQRFYISIVDQFGNLVVARPMVGSPALNTLTSIEWNDGIVTAVSESFLGFTVGSLVNIAVTYMADKGVLESTIFESTIIGPNTFTYPLAMNPWISGACAIAFWSLDNNLAGGFFDDSTLVFRVSTQNFEITP